MSNKIFIRTWIAIIVIALLAAIGPTIYTLFSDKSAMSYVPFSKGHFSLLTQRAYADISPDDIMPYNPLGSMPYTKFSSVELSMFAVQDFVSVILVGAILMILLEFICFFSLSPRGILNYHLSSKHLIINSLVITSSIVILLIILAIGYNPIAYKHQYTRPFLCCRQ